MVTNHVKIVRNAIGQFAYVTISGLNEMQVFRTSDFSKVATIAVGKLPHGIWPSGDGSRSMSGWKTMTKWSLLLQFGSGTRQPGHDGAVPPTCGMLHSYEHLTTPAAADDSGRVS